MRRAVLLLLPLAVAIATVGSGCGSDGSSKSETTTLRFFWTESGEKLAIDLAPKGKVNRGDVIRATSVVRNLVAQLGRARGARVGRVVATFHVVSPRKARIVLRLTLPAGGLEAKGPPSTAPWHGHLEVTRGTGRFKGAQGTADLRQFLDRSVSTFRVILPPAD